MLYHISHIRLESETLWQRKSLQPTEQKNKLWRGCNYRRLIFYMIIVTYSQTLIEQKTIWKIQNLQWIIFAILWKNILIRQISEDELPACAMQFFDFFSYFLSNHPFPVINFIKIAIAIRNSQFFFRDGISQRGGRDSSKLKTSQKQAPWWNNETRSKANKYVNMKSEILSVSRTSKTF